MTVKKPSNIVNRVAFFDSVLKGYMVYTADGILRKLTVKDTLALEGTCKIANGKIYHTSSGDIISSISGSYVCRL